MKKRAFKRLAFAFLIFTALCSAGLIYLNKVVLPVKIKTLIIQNIEKQTGKKAALESVQFNIFKGLVLTNLNLYDGQKKLIGIREASCSFLILPILKEKKIIIPSLKIKSPYLFIERKSNNAINLMELMPAREKIETKNPQFSFIVSRVNITDADIDFQDSGLSSPFTKSIENLNLSARLSLAAGVKFTLNARLKTNPISELGAEGEFRLSNKELTAKIYLKNLPPAEFAAYYNSFGLLINKGTVDAYVDLKFDDNRIRAGSKIRSNGIQAVKDKITVKLNSEINAGINYNLKDKQLLYSGSADITETNIFASEAIGEINDISAKITFDNNAIASDKITASYAGIIVEARARLSDFNNPVLSLEAKSELDLKLAQNILSQRFKLSLPLEASGKGRIFLKLKTPLPIKEMPPLSGSLAMVSAEAKYNQPEVAFKNIKGSLEFNLDKLEWADLSFDCLDSSFISKGMLSDFKNPLLKLKLSSSKLNLGQIQNTILEQLKLKFPLKIDGYGKLSLNLKTKLPAREIPRIDGSLDIASANIQIDKINQSLEGINGHLEWTQSMLKWSTLNFSYLDTFYTTDGQINDFSSGLIDFSLSSPELKLKSNILLNNRQIKISSLQGKYLNSDISLWGNIDTSDTRAIYADINTGLEIDLADLEKPLAKYKSQLEKIKPSGRIRAKISLNGNVNDLKHCQASAKLQSSALSAYGLKAEEFLLDYNQANGLADIGLLHLSLYDGFFEAAAKINLESENQPFWIDAKTSDIKIEKLKLDTALKDKDLSGTVRAIAKVNGFLKDISKLSGAGKIQIAEGKIWEFNLFKGLGKLLFTKDFTDIVFSEGYCEFFIKDKEIFTDKLILKSSLVSLEGKGKIGFDSTLDVSLNIQMGDELAPVTGTIRDITTAIMGQAGRFATIRLSGTLQKPQYEHHFTPVDVLKGLKDTIIESIFGQ